MGFVCNIILLLQGDPGPAGPGGDKDGTKPSRLGSPGDAGPRGEPGPPGDPGPKGEASTVAGIKVKLMLSLKVQLCKSYARFFYKQCFFSAQPHFCLTFYRIEL